MDKDIRAPIELREGWQAIEVRWFATSQSYVFGPLRVEALIGAVLTRTGDGLKAYLGLGLGHNLHDDVLLIALNGCRLDNATAQALFPGHENWCLK